MAAAMCDGGKCCITAYFLCESGIYLTNTRNMLALAARIAHFINNFFLWVLKTLKAVKKMMFRLY